MIRSLTTGFTSTFQTWHRFCRLKREGYASADGSPLTSTIDAPAIGLKVQSKTYRQINVNTIGRYVKVEVDGGTAWTMSDELEVRGS